MEKRRKLYTVSVEGQSTIEKLKHEMIDAVLDDRYVVVALHGIGGVGKTTLLRYANNYFTEKEHFDSVIFTTVSPAPNFAPNFVEMRKQIAESLGLETWKDDEDLKTKLYGLSFSIGKYLLILDDMWESIALNKLCIVQAPNKENGCKILMASGSVSVINRFVTRFTAIDSLRLIPVNKLQHDDAWNLFVEKVGMAIISKPEIEPLAKEVLRKCDGLPLVIVVIGGTMSTRETEGEWKEAVRELEQKSLASNHLQGIDDHEEVFSKLIFSFEKLQPIEQSVFLYSCLFPEDYNIEEEELVNVVIGEETDLMCDEMQHKLEDVRNKVAVLVEKLQNSLSMLEDAGNGNVKLHDVMRQLGLWITSPTTSSKFKYIAKAGAGICEAPHASEWAQANKISLMDNEDIESLPELTHLCPKLDTLLLQKCSRIKKIPQVHFLEQMPALVILDLSWTRVKKLPPSISNLVNLRLLSLRECNLIEKLPPEIGMLLQLISLDLFGCDSLIKLPVEMKKLKNLRRLDIGSTEMLKRIPHGLLSGLQKLEEFDAEDSELILYTSDIMELSQLTHLTITKIPMAKIKKVKVSHWLKALGESMECLFLQNCEIDPSALPDLLEDSEDLYREVVFKSCAGLTRVPTRGCDSLTVQDCPDLKTLLMIEEEVEKRNINAFQSLDKLKLGGLDELETICIGIPQPGFGCFTNLVEIRIHGCPNLKVLFTNGVTKLLTELKELCVYRCSQVVKLVSDDDEDLWETDDAFPSLERISLCELPELTAICDLDLNWPSLSSVHIYLCPKLRRSPFGGQHADKSLNDGMDSQMTQKYLHEKRWEEKEEEDEDEELTDDDCEDDDDDDEEEEEDDDDYDEW